jgi:hypothetical protein
MGLISSTMSYDEVLAAISKQFTGAAYTFVPATEVAVPAVAPVATPTVAASSTSAPAPNPQQALIDAAVAAAMKKTKK